MLCGEDTVTYLHIASSKMKQLKEFVSVSYETLGTFSYLTLLPGNRRDYKCTDVWFFFTIKVGNFCRYIFEEMLRIFFFHL